MNRTPAKRDPTVKSVSRALSILEAFSLEQPSLSLSDFSRKTGFYKSSILRQVKTLLDAGYMVRDSETGRYRLGTKPYILGQIFLRSSSLLGCAGPILKAIASELGETASIFVEDGSQRLCLAMEQGPHFIRATYEIGQKLPIYAGASGKVLMAFLEDALFQRVVAEAGLKSFTAQTITKRSVLKAELEKIRKSGYALSIGERVSSAAAVAVPVFGAGGGLVCSLSTSGPIDRFTDGQIPHIISVLQEAGQKLSKELGYLGNYWQKIQSWEDRSNGTCRVGRRISERRAAV